jgi:hypothetical protein
MRGREKEEKSAVHCHSHSPAHCAPWSDRETARRQVTSHFHMSALDSQSKPVFPFKVVLLGASGGLILILYCFSFLFLFLYSLQITQQSQLGKRAYCCAF